MYHPVHHPLDPRLQLTLLFRYVWLLLLFACLFMLFFVVVWICLGFLGFVVVVVVCLFVVVLLGGCCFVVVVVLHVLDTCSSTPVLDTDSYFATEISLRWLNIFEMNLYLLILKTLTACVQGIHICLTTPKFLCL